MVSSGIEVAFLGYVSLSSGSLSVFPVSVPMSDAITATQAIISRQGCTSRSSASGPPIVVFQRICGLDCNVLTSHDGSVVIVGTSETTGWCGRGFAVASLLRELSIAAARESKGCSHDTLANVWRASRFGAAKETTSLQNSKPLKRPQVVEDASMNQLSQFRGGISKGQGSLLKSVQERTTLEATFFSSDVKLSPEKLYEKDSLTREGSREVMQPVLDGAEQPVVPLQHDYPPAAQDTSPPLDSVALSTSLLAQVSLVDNVGSGGSAIGVSNREPQMQQPEYIQTLKGQEFQVHIALVEDLEVTYQGPSLQCSTISGKARFTACPVPCVLTITDPHDVVENVRPNREFLSNVETEYGNARWRISCNTSSEVGHPGDDATLQKQQHWVDALEYNCSNSHSPVPLRVYCKVKEGSAEPSGFVPSHKEVLVTVNIVANPKLSSPLLGVKVIVKLSSLSPTANMGGKGTPELTPSQNTGWNPEYSIAWWDVPKLSAGESIKLEARIQCENNNLSAPLPTYVPVQARGYSKNANFSGALLSITADDVLAPGLSVTGLYNSRLRFSYTLS